MSVIWKYNLRVADDQIVEMPSGARMIAVQEQLGSIALWAWCDPDALPEARFIEIHGTGNRIPKQAGTLVHIGTTQVDGFVWHVFERTHTLSVRDGERGDKMR